MTAIISVRTALDLLVVFCMFFVLGPLLRWCMVRFRASSTVSYGLAAILSASLLLVERGGFIARNAGIVIVLYFVYAWYLERRLSNPPT
jgi:hypothetical protein